MIKAIAEKKKEINWKLQIPENRKEQDKLFDMLEFLNAMENLYK